MKKLLLLLSVLMFALPAFAAEPAGAAAKPAAKESAAPAKESPKKEGGASTQGVTVACPQQCRYMMCPPPSGPSKLCCPVVPFTQTCP